jgi:uncharacterized membrane protein YqhA
MAQPCKRLCTKGKVGDRHYWHQLYLPFKNLHQCGELRDDKVLIAQTAIHVTFLFSAMAIACTDRPMSHP